jgi:cytochrome c553
MSNRKALLHLRTLPPTVIALAAAGIGGSALAQSVTNGETLYKKQFTFPVTGGVACQDCHGPAYIFKAASSASAISGAINADRGGMKVLQSMLSTTEIADIAAYVAQASPPTTPPFSLPPGSPAPAPTPAPAPAPAPTNAPSISPKPAMFSSTEIGKYSATLGIQVTNSTQMIVYFANPALVPASGSGSEFVPTAAPSGTPGCLPGGYLQPGMSCSFGVQFAPLASGPRSETWSIKFDNNVAAQEVTLEGTAIASSGGSSSPTAAPTSSANAPGGGGALGWLGLAGLLGALGFRGRRRKL